MRYKHLIIIFILILGAISLSLINRSGKLETNLVSGSTMGTTYSIKVITKEVDLTENKKLTMEITDVLRDVEAKMSTFLSDSEISAFNNFHKRTWFQISKDTAEVIDCSLYISRISKGAFDITVGPLVNLWGFGPDKRIDQIPEYDTLRKIKKFVGYNNIQIRHSPPAIKKKFRYSIAISQQLQKDMVLIA